MTPRKTQRRHHNNSSHARPVPVSDYESDVHYSAPAPSRDPADINFSVIKRYVPALTNILAIAASAAIYILTPDNSSAGAEWKRAEIEGTLFVCQLEPSPMTGAERHCIVVLNRKGMDNLIIESGEIDNVQITPEFLILKFIRNGEDQIMGFFIQSSLYPKDHICQLIQQHWEAAKEAHESMGGSYGDDVFESIEPEDGYKPMGRRLSLTELFGQR